MQYYISRLLLIIALSFCVVAPSMAQRNFGLGASIIGNPQTESFAAGIRADIRMDPIRIVPQVSYYPGFNKIHEYFGGVSIHYVVTKIKRWNLYGLVNGSFNGWINHEGSSIENAQHANWAAEGGIGLARRKCLSPFIEYRYNLKWQETNLQVGLVYFFNCKEYLWCPTFE